MSGSLRLVLPLYDEEPRLEINRWRGRVDVEEAAYADLRSDSERQAHQHLREEVMDELARAGLTDLVPQVDQLPFVAALDPRLPEPTHAKMRRMPAIGLPTAVFVGPPTTAG